MERLKEADTADARVVTMCAESYLCEDNFEPIYLATRVESHAQPIENKGEVTFVSFRGPQALTDNLPNP